MEPGGGIEAQYIRVARTLPIDAALLGDVLLRLRRDSAAAPLRWNLGERGAVEIDTQFTPANDAWTTSARVWDAGGLAVAGVRMSLQPVGPDAVDLVLAPTAALTPWWQARLPELLDLARAAIDELAEELLWHATRAGVASRG